MERFFLFFHQIRTPHLRTIMATSKEDMEDVDDAYISLEERLARLDTYDNATQLNLLQLEIVHIVDHAIQPSPDWYVLRMRHLMEYENLNWEPMSDRFRDRDEYVHDACLRILRDLRQLIEEAEIHPPFFSLDVYYSVIHEIDAFWPYYYENYWGDSIVAAQIDKEDEAAEELLTRLWHI